MADVHTKKQRSYNMSQIRSKNTKPEMLVRSWLHKQGYRFRLHDKKLPGKPDIVLKKYKTVIFVNGCFWHGHKNCRYFVIPKSKKTYWIPKITRNILNQRNHRRNIKKLQWNVIIIWECKLKKNKVGKTMNQIDTLLQNRI
jgi:DNA mismatch endonuclease, patch repair protein